MFYSEMGATLVGDNFVIDAVVGFRENRMSVMKISGRLEDSIAMKINVLTFVAFS